LNFQRRFCCSYRFKPIQSRERFYVFDRKTSTWFWIDFDDQQYGGYSVNDFDLLIHEYDFLSLVERPGLLRATPGWLLEPGKPAEMAAPLK
jgi:hypothetical protein